MDSGGALRVGPHSAGARPGPAAYGHGGTEPTVTDANVVLGRLPADRPLSGGVTLDGDAAAAVVGDLAARLGLGLGECAEGIVTVAVQEMVRALRRVSVERGEDPREAVLIAFGGAGPLHACPVADELGIRRVLAPPAAGVLAALGLVIAGERRDEVQTVLAPVDGGAGLADLLAPLRERLLGEMPDAALSAAVDVRYAGQSHSLTVPWEPGAPEAELAAAFHDAHRERFGDADPGRAVEAVTLRLAAERPGEDPEIAAADAGDAVTGPAVIPMEGATCWVGEGWTARADARGVIVMERVD
jgi:N-methylhydantoinase A/oxoprolinase/acetone carboxylase beta subunit